MTALRSATEATSTVRELDDRDLADLQRLVDTDPITNAVVAARIESAGTLRGERLGGALVGVGAPGDVRAACFFGGNMLPVGGGPDEWRALAAHAGSGPRRCSSIIAASDAVSTLWPLLAPHWGPARIIRACQPLLVTASPAAETPDPELRPARMQDIDRYLPAAAAMFAEELGAPAFRGSGRPAYRLRLAELIAAGRAFVRLDERGEVVFKAELAAVSRRTSQIQGVWVRPDCRGQGVATSAMAALIARALHIAPTVSLYVNDFNVPARRLYARLGLRQVGALSTILF